MNTTITETLLLLNPWWKEGRVPSELVQPYRRKVIEELHKLLPYRQILLISGLRRVGKTTLLYQLLDELTRRGTPKHYLYFNLDKEVEELDQVLGAYQELTHVDWKKESITVFIDEIARLPEWGRKIKLLYDAFPHLKFVVSSSSSFLLEEEAIQRLAGRYFLVKVLPLSFPEFLELKGKGNWVKDRKLWSEEIRKAIHSYLLRSFPETITWDDELLVKDYLRTTIIDKIVRQDLPEKYKGVQREVLFTLLRLFYSEPGIYLETDGLAQKLRISKKTLLQHINYLESSYLIRRIRNFRVSTLSSSRKMQRIYPYWWTLAYCYSPPEDKIMENLVASVLDLTYYWREKEKEVDFLLVKDKVVIPLEVKNKENLSGRDRRWLDYFLATYDSPSGFVIYTGKEIISQGKITAVPLWELLMEGMPEG